jgi:glycosyltransferase involved in cell wall biosynthesis
MIKMKILIIVPAYNEEKNISRVISELYKTDRKWDILVVNDGSKDNTFEVAESSGKALVVNLPCNLGIGGAVQTGFKYGKNNNYDIAIQFDGDCQHKASEIKKLIEPIIKGESDVVIGSRFCKKHDGFKSTFTRRMGIKVFEIINSILIKQKITDNTSGFRAYNRKAMEFLSEYYPMDYPEPEAVILLGRNCFRIMEIYTEMLERQGGESSITGLKSIYYMIKVILAVIMSSIRPRIKRKI